MLGPAVDPKGRLLDPGPGWRPPKVPVVTGVDNRYGKCPYGCPEPHAPWQTCLFGYPPA
jgi:hypothetical protein